MSKFSSYFDSDSEMTERFIEGAFESDSRISNFGDFKYALSEYLKLDNRGDGALKNIDEDDFIKLFESIKTKDKIKDNVSEEEYEKLYGDGIKVQRVAVTPKSMVVITYPKIKSKSYLRNGKSIKTYERFKSRPFTSAEVKFLTIKKDKNISPKQIIKEYNKHFKGSERTESSISSKLYRI